MSEVRRHTALEVVVIYIISKACLDGLSGEFVELNSARNTDREDFGQYKKTEKVA